MKGDEPAGENRAQQLRSGSPAVSPVAVGKISHFSQAPQVQLRKKSTNSIQLATELGKNHGKRPVSQDTNDLPMKSSGKKKQDLPLPSDSAHELRVLGLFKCGHVAILGDLTHCLAISGQVVWKSGPVV